MAYNRGHEPIVIEEFNGLWKRGPADECPDDHFTDCENIQFIEGGIRTRDGLDTLFGTPQGSIVRIYNYVMQSGESILALTSEGDIYHALLDGSETVHGPILSIPEMTDFGFQAYAGRAYITPYTTFLKDTNEEYQKGLENEFVYVYKGDGSAARRAAGQPPTNDDDTTIVVYNSQVEGKIEKGAHYVAVGFGNGSGGTSSGLGPGVLPVFYAPGEREAIIRNLPVGPSGVTERIIYATKVIAHDDFNPDPTVYTFYEVKVVPDNETEATTISFTDAELTVPFAAGSLPNATAGGMTAENTATEDLGSDLGLHVIGVVYETDTGYLTSIGPETKAVVTVINGYTKIKVSNIPTSPDDFVVKRHLVATKALTNYNGDDDGYQFFFIPDGTIEDNTTTEWEGSFFDIDLIEDASYLVDNFAEIPAGVTLTTYNGRLVLTTTFTDISVAYLSAPGEPEAIDQVDGIIIFPLDGDPITTAQEFRDVLYLYKKTKTSSTNDNGDVPSTWEVLPIDQGIGAPVHGVAQVLDSGGVNIEFLLIVDWSGLMLFNGTYARPELSWKIADLWYELDRNSFKNIQIMNDSLTQKIYITLPDKKMLMADYQNGLDPKNIRWTKWRFDIETTTIALIDTNTVVIGSDRLTAESRMNLGIG